MIPLDDLTPSKKSNKSTEKTKLKLSTPTSTYKRKGDGQKHIHEVDVDIENLPVIHGSFEITKTDADIAQKRTDANQKYIYSILSYSLNSPYKIKIFSILRSTASLNSSTLKPFFITPASIKIRPAENQSSKAPVTESIFLEHQKQQNISKFKEAPVTAKIEKTNKNGETTVSRTIPTKTPLLTTTLHDEAPQDFAKSPMNSDLPKLDVSLFTSAPILDSEPWRPINPSPSQIKVPALLTEKADLASTDIPDFLRSPFNTNSQENVMYRNKFVDPTVNEANDSMLYQSYYNTGFSHGDLAIEKLGIAELKPYPLPVNKIESFPDTDPKLVTRDQTEADNIKVNYDESKFEHLGAGVIAKKPEANSVNISATTAQKLNESLKYSDNDRDKQNTTELVENLDDIFQDLLELEKGSDALNLNKTNDNKLESRVAPEDSLEDFSTDTLHATTERLNFMNMKDFIVQMQRNKSEDDIVHTTEMPTTAFVEVETLKYTPPAVSTTQNTASQPQLFPMNSKWEFVNGTQVNITDLNVTKKVFNETLQAVVVENTRTVPPPIIVNRFNDLKTNRTVDNSNLQQLSSIFDTLASRLGIKHVDDASKMPPFSQQNKLKNNSSWSKSSTTTDIPKISSPTPMNSPSDLSKVSETSATVFKQDLREQKTTPASIKVTDYVQSSSESMIGEAEVEPVDPTQYEEILSLISSSPVTVTISTSTTPSLVTLLPVKSHSGVRNFNPRIKSASRNEAPKIENSQSRLYAIEAPYDYIKKLETVVEASVSFDS